jgi:hypothetical protein
MKNTQTKTKKPKTHTEWSACRCQLACRIGRDALCGKNENPMHYAIFNLLHAIEELSKQIEGKE